jgi:hypothetical protein
MDRQRQPAQRGARLVVEDDFSHPDGACCTPKNAAWQLIGIMESIV